MLDAFMSQVREDARCRITHQRREIVRRDGVARFDDDVRIGAHTATKQMVVDACDSQ